MIKLLLPLALLQVCLFAAQAPTASPADADFAAFQSLAAAKLPEDTPNALASLRWNQDHVARINELGTRFMAAYPADPRRWDVALVLLEQKPHVVKVLDEAKVAQGKPNSVPRGTVELDAAATDKERERLAALDARCAAATDMTAETRRSYLFRRVEKALREARFALVGSITIDMATGIAERVKGIENPRELRPVVDELIAKYPEEERVVDVFTGYVNLFRRRDPPAYKAELESYAGSASAKVSAAAKDALVFLAAEGKPFDWKFTAADGREVDFAQLRGKVVLIDFWATWCGPCKAEIPNILANYRKYHDQGFEVVGITLEKIKTEPGDTPEQTAAKLAKAKQALLDFVAKEGLPWPQHFDGAGFKNAFSSRYGIASIPTMFLLDQRGILVSMSARGPKLESELKRLLMTPRSFAR